MRALQLLPILFLGVPIAAPAGAELPLDVSDATPRSVRVQLELSVDPALVGQSFAASVPGSWSVGGGIGRIEVGAADHEQMRGGSFLPPVPGSFQPLVIEIDLLSLEATSDPTSGAFSNGTQSATFSTAVLDTTATAGFISPDFAPLFCASQQEVDDLCLLVPALCGQTCLVVPGAPYDPSTGKINLVGPVVEEGCDGAVCSGPFTNFASTGDLRLLESPFRVPSASGSSRFALELALLGAAAWLLRGRRSR